MLMTKFALPSGCPMNRLLVPSSAALALALLVVSPSWAQKTQQPSQPAQPSASVPNPNATSNMPGSREVTGPLYVNGRVLMETGQPVPEPVSVALDCGMRTVQAIHTDAKGYFQFALGAGPQSNVDLSASDDTSPGMGGMAGMGGAFGSAMMGCELRVDVSGYEPVTRTITAPPDIGGIDAGTLLLRRRNGVEGSSISVTSLQVPEKARKEFEQGQKDEHSNHLPSAEQHMLKAVGVYDKYAAAWNELGKIQASNRELDKARDSFTKAINADPHYIPPYLSFAALDLQTDQYDDAEEKAAKVLELDPTIGFASFVQGAADVKLNKLDEAEKAAKDAENEPHQAFPQVHLLLAELFEQKEDYSNAATQLRAYLKEAPKGTLAAQAKKNLDEIEKQASAATTPGPGAEQPQSAP
jgi:tetratricopeptide (TPR) repeat protein